MSEFKTEQESFWSGSFGDAYVERNRSAELLASNIALFSKILGRTTGVDSALELGANIGMNMRALKALRDGMVLSGVEINHQAVEQLRQIEGVEAIEGSILDVEVDRTWMLTFTKGVLIHINPEHLASVYERLYRYSSRYIVVIEYYNPSPVEIVYRGHASKLFKRDFAGELMDLYSDLKLLDYGFVWRRDPVFPQDDLTWFLFEKGL